jgi:hypothetical protein
VKVVLLVWLTMVIGSSMVWSDRNAGWEAGLANDLDGSADLLEEALGPPPVDPVTEFSFAAALLSRQPLSQDNIQQALEICTRLGAGLEDPSLQLRARFLAARIQQAHLDPLRLDAAADAYRAILQDFPGDPVADLAGVKLAVILTDQSPDLDPADLLAELDGISSRLVMSEAKRELYLSRADVCRQRLDQPALALDHLIAARREGFQSEERNANLDVIIAGLARELDETEIALFHYRRFVEERPFDQRSGTIRRFIGEMEAPGS